VTKLVISELLTAM